MNIAHAAINKYYYYMTTSTTTCCITSLVNMKFTSPTVSSNTDYNNYKQEEKEKETTQATYMYKGHDITDMYWYYDFMEFSM